MPKIFKETITWTFAECGENHTGNELIDRAGNPGKQAKRGFLVKDLEKIAKDLQEQGYDAKVHYLGLSDEIKEAEGLTSTKAAILVCPGFLSKEEANTLFEEGTSLTWDSKYLDPKKYTTDPETGERTKGRVMNKQMRSNLLVVDEGREANYEEGKGTLIAFDDLPELCGVSDRIESVFEDALKGTRLIAEGNRYSPLNEKGKEKARWGIGFHGDTERRIVIGLRLGRSANLVYEWHLGPRRLGSRYEFQVDHGTLYAMSDKATGHDWKLRKIPTLRHAVGSKKVVE